MDLVIFNNIGIYCFKKDDKPVFSQGFINFRQRDIGGGYMVKTTCDFIIETVVNDITCTNSSDYPYFVMELIFRNYFNIKILPNENN